MAAWSHGGDAETVRACPIFQLFLITCRTISCCHPLLHASTPPPVLPSARGSLAPRRPGQPAQRDQKGLNLVLFRWPLAGCGFSGPHRPIRGVTAPRPLGQHRRGTSSADPRCGCVTASIAAVCSAIYSGSERGGSLRKWKPSRIAVGLERQTW
jgi:hypothetical protein